MNTQLGVVVAFLVASKTYRNRTRHPSKVESFWEMSQTRFEWKSAYKRKFSTVREQMRGLLARYTMFLRTLMSVHEMQGSGYKTIPLISYCLLETTFAMADHVEEALSDFDVQAVIPPEVRTELRTFSTFLRLWKGSRIDTTPPTTCNATDAPNTRWCVIRKKHLKHNFVSEHWSDGQTTWHISRRKTYAVTYSGRLLVERNNISGGHILVQQPVWHIFAIRPRVTAQ